MVPLSDSKKPVLLTIENLSVFLGGQKVLDNLMIDIYEGEIIAVVGPNGAGKTTLFRVLLGLVKYEGKITWHKKIKIGYVPQRIYVGADLPLTIAEFFALKTVKKEFVFKILKEMGFGDERHIAGHIFEKKLGVLSGGELQRILIAWALVGDPDILLFDEPAFGLETGGALLMYNVLRNLQQEKGLTILLISHDLGVVYKYAERVLCLNKKALCLGVPQDSLRPEILKGLYGEDASAYRHNHGQ